MAAFVIAAIASVRKIDLQVYSYWTFSDVFEVGVYTLEIQRLKIF